MRDLISRQAAIDVIDFECGEWRGLAKTIVKEIDHLPSVQPEQKIGRWIPKFDGKFKGGAYWFYCSECERVAPDVRNGGWSFCPQCGADMRGNKDERLD